MPIFKIQKRNGSVVDFDHNKITQAIQSALVATGVTVDHAESLSQDVMKRLAVHAPNSIPTVEYVQDTVESVLMSNGFEATAKAYIVYRQEQNRKRQHKDVVVEVKKTIVEYLNQLDWRVNANSNQGYSLGGMILNTAGKVIANYWLSHVYPQAIGEAHRNADLHIHDLDMFSGYCAGWSLRALLEEGFNGVPGKVESAPPKHLSSAVSQMVNFLGTLQNEWAGAQAFSSFDTYLAPFVKLYEEAVVNEIQTYGLQFADDEQQAQYIDDRVYRYVHQNIQSFVFNLNIPSRWGTQTPFTNITLDWNCPDDLRDKRLMIDGVLYKYTYGELQPQIDMLNKAFIEVMTAGDANGRVFTFPIPTYNIEKDFDWDDPKNDALFEMTAKYGVPYFQNFVNSDLNPGDVRSMCCRLQLDLQQLKQRGGGLFGSVEMTGSIGVVTINAARIGYTARGDKDAFFEQLGVLMDLARDSLEIKRVEIQTWIDQGLFPYTRRYLGMLRNHFSTIGINGLQEAIRNFTNDTHDITDEYGQAFAHEVLEYMRERLTEYQMATGHMYNLEATPAEGTTYRFAKEDKKQFADILQAGTETAPYYTNSSQLPVGYSDDVFEALDLQDELQVKYTGGTVLHCYMNERITSATACKSLVRAIVGQYRLPYFTITPTFSICPKHGYLAGEYDFCPKCDEALGITDGASHDHEYRKQFISA